MVYLCKKNKMKYFLYVLIALSLFTMVFNVTFLDFSNLLAGQSKTAIIAIMASACVLVIVGILLISKKIEKKYREQN